MKIVKPSLLALAAATITLAAASRTDASAFENNRAVTASECESVASERLSSSVDAPSALPDAKDVDAPTERASSGPEEAKADSTDGEVVAPAPKNTNLDNTPADAVEGKTALPEPESASLDKEPDSTKRQKPKEPAPIQRKVENQIVLDGGIIKKESVFFRRHKYEGDLAKNPYKYLTVSVEINYVKREKNDVNSRKTPGRTIASAFLEFNFRYNPILREAKCLSTSRRHVVNGKKYEISAFARTKNLAIDVGESYAKVKLFHKSHEKDKCEYIFSCDHLGKIFRCFN